jgi:putative transposase
MKDIIKAYRYRVYPNKVQRECLESFFGAKRHIYNYFLALNKELLNNKEYKLNYKAESALLTALKKELSWLSQADKFSLQNAIKDQDKAFTHFFQKRSGFPRFKNKKDSYQSYRTNFTNGNIEIKENKIKLPKIGWVRCVKSREPLGKILNVTVSQMNEKYYISIVCETQIEPKSMPIQSIGIDLGLTSLMVTQTDQGEIDDIANPKWLEKSLKNLKRKQKQLSKKQHSRTKGDTTPKSKSYLKQQKIVAKIYEKVANQRKDFLHQLSTMIVSENQAIGIEDLHVKGLMKNHKLSRHIAQSGWRMFREMLEYKAEWHNRTLKVHDRFYPSSRLCTCGVVNKELVLSDRIWICKACGSIHQRDELAANNLIPVEQGEFTPRECALSGAEEVSNA